jgi:ribonuclease HI
MQSGAGMNLSQSTEFKGWAKSRGVVLDLNYLPLLVLAGKPTPQAPWMAHCVKAWSALMSFFDGAYVKHSDIPKLPLWNNRLFMVSGGTRAPTALVKESQVFEEVADLSGDCELENGVLPGNWICRRGLTNEGFAAYETNAVKLVSAWQSGRNILKKGSIFTEGAMRSPLSLSQCVGEVTNVDERQPIEVWRKLSKLQLPGKDKDFIRQALWKKLPTGLRLQRIFPSLSRLCPLCGVVEDNNHRLKACPFLSPPLLVLRQLFGPVEVAGSSVEISRLCTDHALLSLSTVQGVLLWKAIHVLWIYRCRVLFDKERADQLDFIRLLKESLSWWQVQPALAVSTHAVHLFRSGLGDLALRRQGLPTALAGAGQGYLSFVTFARGQRTRKRQVSQGNSPIFIDFMQTRVSSDCCEVYTDGSFAFEAPGIGFAGCGVFVPTQPHLSLSIPLPGDIQTNNRAELYALYLGLTVLPPQVPLLLYSDSQFVVKGATLWLRQWKENGFKGTCGHSVAHSDLWQLVDNALQGREGAWAIRWTAGHVGISGNEQADRLANSGRLQHPGRVAYLARSILPHDVRLVIL